MAFGRGCGFASGRLLGQLDPGWNLQLEGEANFSLSWGMKPTQKLLCMGLFSKKLNGQLQPFRPVAKGRSMGADHARTCRS